MIITIEREIENFKQTFEVEDLITDIDEEEGFLKIYINTGDENTSNFASVALTKDEIVSIAQRFNELKDRIKTQEELEAEDSEDSGDSGEAPMSSQGANNLGGGGF